MLLPSPFSLDQFVFLSSVRVADGKLYHPDGAWDPETVYFTVYSKRKLTLGERNHVSAIFLVAMISDVKRKGVGEQHEDSIISTLGSGSTQNLDCGSESADMLEEGENDPNRRCVDLIVLGISYRSLEADVKKCFEAFGELIFCEVRTNDKHNDCEVRRSSSQIKRDANGQSRGFGFVRFKNFDSQLAVINKRHFIDGRHVDVKIPDSKVRFVLAFVSQWQMSDVSLDLEKV